MQNQSRKIIKLLFAGVVGVSGYFALSYFFSGEDKFEGQESNQPIEDQVDVVDLNSLLPSSQIVEPSADELADSMGMTMQFDDPADLVNQVMKQMSRIDSERDIQGLAQTLGNGEANTEQLDELRRLFENQRMKLRSEDTIELLGEVKAGKISRWSLHLDDESKIQLQTTRQKDGTWKIEDVKFPLSNLNENGEPMTQEQVKQRNWEIDSKDSLLFSSHFLKELVSQNFEKARSMVNQQTITDAKIAGLCILFEDGAYSLNEKKPLQAVRVTNEISAFYANVDAQEGGKAQFAITAIRDSEQSAWMINEINLDRLLGDYAKRIAGGDVYYRTKKQLEIVVSLLKLDTNKKIRLSGHTDGKGSDEYNQGLSKERALAVKEYLIHKGIQEKQVVTEAHGFSKPIREESNTDDANARRANRRTEIYLDF